MRILIVIPAHNEEAFIGQTLSSLAEQSHLPERIVVVDDRSTDATAEIVLSFAEKYPFIDLLHHESMQEVGPGAAVISAFQAGLDSVVMDDFDLICKYDADLVFPPNYLFELSQNLKSNSRIGMVGGVCTVEQDGSWQVEGNLRADHLRGALKAYTKKCYRAIGGLPASMGWDTYDELMAKYHGFEVKVLTNLEVSHLRPTGANYSRDRYERQGEAFYKIGYNLSLVMVTAAKLSPQHMADYIRGYRTAKRAEIPRLVDNKQARFIRKLRWKGVRNKLNIFAKAKGEKK